LANKRSAMKAHRVGERRHARNRPVRSALRTYVKKARVGLQGGAVDEAAALVAEAAKNLDEAASKGIIHKNQAARRKSRLMHQLAVAARAAATAPEAPVVPARARARRTTTGGTVAGRTTAGGTGARTTTARTSATSATESPPAVPARRTRRTAAPKEPT